MYKLAYQTCRGNPTCSKVISETDGTILNAMYADAYSKIEGTSMTNEQWDIARIEAEKLTKIAEDT